MTIAIDELLRRLDGVKQISANQWEAACPAHFDTKPSLAVSIGDEGRILLYCHAGCAAETIADKISLTLAMLGPASRKSRPSIVAEYSYRDETGALIFQVVRFDPKDFRQRCPDNGGWRWSVKGVRVVPYRLPELLARPNDLVIVAEGEKDCDNLAAVGLLATCNAGGASKGKSKWRTEHTESLRGRHVAIIPDADEPGRAHAQHVARSLSGIAASVKIVALPGDGKDASDWLAAGGTADQLRELCAAAPEFVAGPTPTTGSTAAAAEPRKSQTEQLIELVAGAELWKTSDYRLYCTFRDGAARVRKTLSINSRDFARMLRKRFYDEYEKPPQSESLANAIAHLDAQAGCDGAEHEIHVRMASYSGRVFLDLADDEWRCVEIGPDGWTITADPPVYFRRPAGMLPLPSPERGGSIGELRPFLNVGDDTWPLILAWIVAAVCPGAPAPVLILAGENGSAKSSAAAVIRRLLDPSKAELRAEPKEIQDLMIAAANSGIVALDNLSRIEPWLSDCLCRLATGGAISRRTHYTNDEETIIAARRAVVINGIEDLATRADLLDRAILAECQFIPEHRRRCEVEFWGKFEAARPRILGAVLDAAAVALQRLPNIRLPRRPRMADFATLAVAAEPALGLSDGEFMAAYTGNRSEAHIQAAEGSSIGPALLAYLNEFGGWTGTASELLDNLNTRLGDGKPPKGWPTGPRGLSGALKRLKSNLRQLGWNIDSDRAATRNRTRELTIQRDSGGTVQTVQTVLDCEKQGENVGGRRTVADGCGRLLDGSLSPNLHDRTIVDGSDGLAATLPGVPEVEEFWP